MTIPSTATSARPTGTARSGTSIQLITGRDHPDPDSSTSVAKALALLSSFTPHHPTMGVSEIARRAQLPKSTAHRLLAVLVDWEMVTKRGTEYSPGARLNELGALTKHPDTQELRRVALPHLLDLYEMTHETVNLCVLAGEDALYVDKIHGHNGVNSPACIGARLPAANTAIGKALLAFSSTDVLARVSNNLRPATSSSIASPTQLARELTMIQRSGIAYDRQEIRPGLTCIAAPVRSWSGAVIAAVSISGPVHRFRPANAVPAIRAVAAGVAKLAQEMSWQQHISV
ncbi:IclR family transcriptional regulator [Rhodococcus maanshanensis]|uniref:DNA-binding transcriptional regulator, IclR family n=1 Tax=Rhodococcus maanshanensis TaxID=183556 RepID=A0A1H7I4N2_9NOCA|nr:IclR family transcriptional regulator [Rhodococcus maanshanensis]SEK56727.1 DNA-binding transcriptional regulator, IclR family [Rhodococcus maanshanensis]